MNALSGRGNDTSALATGHRWPNARTRRAAFLLSIAAAHLLIGWLLLRAAAVWPNRSAPAVERAALIVRLLAPTTTAAAGAGGGQAPGLPTAAPTAAPSLANYTTRPARAGAADALDVPQAAALRSSPAVPTTPADVEHLERVAPPAATAPPPLALDLRRPASAPERWRNPAFADPRANTPKPTVESRIAATVGVDWLTEEALAEGRVRFRRNGDCVEVRPNTFAQIDPFNQTVRPLPRLATAC